MRDIVRVSAMRSASMRGTECKARCNARSDAQPSVHGGLFDAIHVHVHARTQCVKHGVQETMRPAMGLQGDE